MEVGVGGRAVEVGRGIRLYVINRKINSPLCQKQKIYFLYAIYYRFLKILYVENKILI